MEMSAPRKDDGGRLLEDMEAGRPITPVPWSVVSSYWLFIATLLCLLLRNDITGYKARIALKRFVSWLYQHGDLQVKTTAPRPFVSLYLPRGRIH
jgi:hypothetical protein